METVDSPAGQDYWGALLRLGVEIGTPFARRFIEEETMSSEEQLAAERARIARLNGSGPTTGIQGIPSALASAGGLRDFLFGAPATAPGTGSLPPTQGVLFPLLIVAVIGLVAWKLLR